MIISNVFNQVFPQSPLIVESSSNNISIIAPTISPFDFINLLAKKSISTSSYREPSFLFYESNTGYKCMSIGTLYSANPSFTWRYSNSTLRQNLPDGESTRDINAEYENAKDMEIINQFNTIEKLTSGAMGNTVYEIDTIRKNIKPIKYSYLDDFSSGSHLNKFPVDTNNLLHSYDDVVSSCVTVPGVFNGYNQDFDATIKARRLAKIMETQFVKIKLVMNGRSDMEVGNMVNFEMGKFSSSDSSTINSDDRIDRYYSGNYLISAIQHRLTMTRHEAVVEIIKDSFPVKVQ